MAWLGLGVWWESSRTGMGMRRFFLCICYTPFTIKSFVYRTRFSCFTAFPAFVHFAVFGSFAVWLFIAFGFEMCVYIEFVTSVYIPLLTCIPVDICKGGFMRRADACVLARHTSLHQLEKRDVVHRYPGESQGSLCAHTVLLLLFSPLTIARISKDRTSHPILSLVVLKRSFFNHHATCSRRGYYPPVGGGMLLRLRVPSLRR
jgi:hypothetical protein